MITAWVTYGRQTVDLGKLPSDTYIMRAHCHVTQAFNGSGSDTITIGNDVDTDAIATSVHVSTTGIKSVTLGVNAGYNSNAQQLKIFFVHGGAEPTTGACLVILETVKTPSSPI